MPMQKGFTYLMVCERRLIVDPLGKPACANGGLNIIVNDHNRRFRLRAHDVARQNGWVPQLKHKWYCPKCAAKLHLIPESDDPAMKELPENGSREKHPDDPPVKEAPKMLSPQEVAAEYKELTKTPVQN